MVLWVPVEKLFMTEIGFTAGTVSVMAAAYAAVVPLLEVPSGILADRRSRSLIMVCASIALLASTLLGGLSTNVPTYIAAAMILGVYFARSEEHTSELQSLRHLVCRLLLEKKQNNAL